MKAQQALLAGFVCIAAGCLRTGPGPAATREAAYRENNRGVAELEQYAYEAAAQSFQRAIALDGSVHPPHINLAIALYHAADLDRAAAAVAEAGRRLPDAPQVHFVRGLIHRSRAEPAAAVGAFQRVLALDRDDVGAMVNLGQIHLQERRLADAASLFRRAVALEPFNATAMYGLGQTLIRSGAADEASAVMARFERLRESGASLTYSQNYLEQGRYAEALVSTGLEADLVDQTAPDVVFADVTTAWAPEAVRDTPGQAGTPATSEGRAIALTDLDGDGRVELVFGNQSGVRALRWTGSRLDEATRAAGATGAGPLVGVIAADLDNDTRTDLLLLHDGGLARRRQEPSGAFVSLGGFHRTRAGLRTAALLDVDHDGDLDVLAGATDAGDAGQIVLLRNNGDASVTDVTAASGLSVAGGARAVAPTDYDNRRDIDVLVLPSGRGPRLLANQRDGSFRDVSDEVGLGAVAAARAVAAGDFNKDGRTDFFVAHDAEAASLVMSRGHTRFLVAAGPVESQGLTAVQAADYDNDGLLDAVGIGDRGLRIFRNVGRGFSDVTARAAGALARMRLAAFALGDIDGDGDLDVAALAGDGTLRLFRNDGASARRSLGIQLRGRVSNRSGVGAKVDVRAGSLWQRLESSAAAPAVAAAELHIGLGAREGADVVRVLWPAGIVQAEGTPETRDTRQQVIVAELDRKPSSCPYLFAWNGHAFGFVTDFLGGGEIGYRTGPREWNTPDADETVRITDRQLTPRDGRLELRVTNELEEVLYLDRLQLLSVEHRADVEVYPREGMRARAETGTRLAAVRRVRPLGRVTTDRGEDVSALVAARDGMAAGSFTLRPVRGYAEPHALILETSADQASARPQVLLLTGWTDYAFSSDNVAASQQGWTLEPPRLEVRRPGDTWRTLVDDVGIPVGRPQTVIVDIGRVANPGPAVLRLVTNMRIHWDQMAIADLATNVALAPRAHALERATLAWRGYSAERPFGTDTRPDYAAVMRTSPWKVFPGTYTHEGPVDELIAAADDLFVVARTGDEMTLAFRDRGWPAEPGTRRTFLLHAVGYSKEMDINSASPDHVLPLPYRGMTRYPPAPAPPDVRARQKTMLDRYNTRGVARALPTLVAPGARRQESQP